MKYISLILLISFLVLAEEPKPVPARKIIELSIGREGASPANENLILWGMGVTADGTDIPGKIEYSAYDEESHISLKLIAFQIESSVVKNLYYKIFALKPTQLTDQSPTQPPCINNELFYWYGYKGETKIPLQILSFCHVYSMINNKAVNDIVTVIDGFYFLAKLVEQK